MLELVREHDLDETLLEHDADERLRRGVTFGELAAGYLSWLEQVKGAKPSTLQDHRSVLAEPGVTHRRGADVTQGRIMGVLGDRPAREITTREIGELLASSKPRGQRCSPRPRRLPTGRPPLRSGQSLHPAVLPIDRRVARSAREAGVARAPDQTAAGHHQQASRFVWSRRLLAAVRPRRRKARASGRRSGATRRRAELGRGSAPATRRVAGRSRRPM